MSFSAGSLVASLLFSSVGFVVFSYGKKTGDFRRMALGGALMVYPYFVTGALAVSLVGLGLTGALFFIPED